MAEAKLIGWREWAALPDLGISRIKMKVDTGARTSCLHAFKIVPFKKHGENWLRLWIHPVQGEQSEHVCEVPLLEKRWVTDSGGHRTLRYVIKTRLQLATLNYEIELTLTNRDNMKFRMLLGRTAMRQRFVVDPARSFLCGV